MTAPVHMSRVHVVLTTIVALTASSMAWSPVAAAQTAANDTDVALYRLFLTDGTSAVSYGDYARVGNEVVFSMPIGRAGAEPDLQLVTLPAAWVDWPRTTRYAATVKYNRYVATRAESDFAALSARVAAMLTEVTETTDTQRALGIADRARELLAAWPSAHYGYRLEDVREIVALIDEVMSGLDGRRRGGGSLQVSLFAAPSPAHVEPILELPSAREQIAWLVTMAHRTARPADRTALLRAALAAAEGADIPLEDVAAVRRSLEAQLRAERAVDERYAAFTSRTVSAARRAAARADVAAVERAFTNVVREDQRLGQRRPHVVHALMTELDAQLQAARDLHRRREHWRVRRPIYRRYVEDVSVQVMQLAKARGTLEAIRDGRGISPERLRDLQERLRGGVERLDATAAPEALRSSKDMLIGAWRFAEHALADGLERAAGDQPPAGAASSAAAGALLLLAQAQDAMRAALEPPTLR